MLRITAIGNLGGDPEVRYTQKGTQIAQFTMAINQVRTGRDGEREESTEWFRVRVSGRQVEFAGRLTKGARVLVIGRLDISHYTSKDGDPRTGYDVWADDIQSFSTRERSDDSNGVSLSGRQESTSRPGPARSAAGADSGPDLEDLPFAHPRFLDEPWLQPHIWCP